MVNITHLHTFKNSAESGILNTVFKILTIYFVCLKYLKNSKKKKQTKKHLSVYFQFEFFFVLNHGFSVCSQTFGSHCIL